MRTRYLLIAMLLVLAIGVPAGYLALRPKGNRAESVQKAGKKWHCPMHPNYISDRPGDCPICGMKLVPVAQEEKGPAAKADTGPQMAGLTTVQISPEKQQLIGVRMGQVKAQPMTKVIRTVGTLEADETRIRNVNTKVAGWIERLFVDFTGQLVQQGQPLLSIYSPELVSTQEEYLVALRQRDRLAGSPFPDVSLGGGSLLAATRRRLELFDVPAGELKRVERSGSPIKNLTLRSPFTGFVMGKNVTEGTKVEPGMPLFTVADLRAIWVQADLYEYELPLVKMGQQAKLTVASYPDRAWYGRVKYLYPSVEQATRTMKVRFEFPNPAFLLKPGMYANLEISVPLGTKLTVPGEAVLDSGTRKVVFLDKGDGYFEPREVKVGQRVDSEVEILRGLAAGDRIVVSGNFLIDSESRLKSAFAGMGAPTGEHAGHGGAPPKQPEAEPERRPATGHEGHNMPGM